MKRICVLLALGYTFGCFLCYVRCKEAVEDWLQADSDRYYRDNIWSYMDNITVNEDEACEQPVTDGIIEFGQHTGSFEETCRIYKWHVRIDDTDGYDVNVTISSLNLNEIAGNYLIISPGPSLVPDEASVIITGQIQTSKMFRVIDHNEMTVLLVIQEGITNETWRDNNFTLSYKAYELTTETPDTTTPVSTYNTPESNVPYDITVYVRRKGDEEFDSTAFKEAVAKMANSYCSESNNNIKLLSDVTADNVNLALITQCRLTWPNWEKCNKINMFVPVSVSPDQEYELTRSNLEKMWKKYAEDVLQDAVFEVYEVPDDTGALHLWLGISLGVVAIFTLLVVALWRSNLFKTSKKKETTVSIDQRISNSSNKSWISENSYQEVPPMTDLQYDDIYNKPRENYDTVISPNKLSSSNENSRSSEQFIGAYYFQPHGYDNPSFDVSSEQHHRKRAGYHDVSSSDDDARENTSKNTKSHHDHPHTAPKKVTYENNNNESAL